MATKSGCRSNWLVGIFAKHGNPYDGVTLAPALTQVEQLTNVSVQQAVVDKGFRGALHHPSHVNVLVSGKRKLCTTIKKLLKRRSAIEPVIGHGKHDHGMGRNYLQGTTGDLINALLAGCGFNLRKICRFFSTSVCSSSASS
jgi:transposase, IS5 family